MSEEPNAVTANATTTRNPVSTLEDAIARLVESINPDKIILFGSRASGHARPDSDIDLLVVADLAGSRLDRAALVSGLLRPRRVAIDLLVYTPEEFAELLARPRSFVKHILATGRVVHDRAVRLDVEGAG